MVLEQSVVYNILECDAATFLGRLDNNSIDLIVSSPPYFVGKEYDVSRSVKDFKKLHDLLLPELIRVLKPGGSICWQIGHHVTNGVEIPLDSLVYASFSMFPELLLRNRIIWSFAHGVHCRRRFSGRHETIMWYTKGGDYYFDLDAVRIPQKYPGKKHYKGPNRGQYSGNPRGKNPGDVWEIPNVNANHVEKTKHPCQFPVALVQRLIKGLCPANGHVLDPYLGSGSSAVAAYIEKRQFSGCDIDPRYIKIACDRLSAYEAGTLRTRPLDLPILIPPPGRSVSHRPLAWRDYSEQVLDA